MTAMRGPLGEARHRTGRRRRRHAAASARPASDNATTIALAYLLVILFVASLGDVIVAVATSVVATLCFNFFFLPPLGTFTIADPHNWVALVLVSRRQHRRQPALDLPRGSRAGSPRSPQRADAAVRSDARHPARRPSAKARWRRLRVTWRGASSWTRVAICRAAGRRRLAGPSRRRRDAPALMHGGARSCLCRERRRRWSSTHGRGPTAATGDRVRRRRHRLAPVRIGLEPIALCATGGRAARARHARRRRRHRRDRARTVAVPRRASRRRAGAASRRVGIGAPGRRSATTCARR